ncbi:hypothetical protein M2351_006271 [Azospirillum canadense]|nr:hypothetical protein [Azospirillum canadense]
MPPAPRALVEMVVVDGLAYQDVAARLDICVGTIRSRLSRAREQIRANLERRRRVCPRQNPVPPRSLGAPRPAPPEPVPPAPIPPAPIPPALAAPAEQAVPLRSPRPSRCPRCTDHRPVRRRPDRRRSRRPGAGTPPAARSRGPPSARRPEAARLPTPPSRTVR